MEHDGKAGKRTVERNLRRGRGSEGLLGGRVRSFSPKGLEKKPDWWESCTMSATVVREKNQTTLPADVLEAAGVRPKDHVDWSFEDGKIVGRKLVPVDIETVNEMPKKRGKVSNASIREAVRAGRR